LLNQWRSQGLNIQIITLLLDDPNEDVVDIVEEALEEIEEREE